MLILCGLADHKRSTFVLQATQVHAPLDTQLPSDLTCCNGNRYLMVEVLLNGMYFLSPLGGISLAFV